jgi:di- and tripeptidase
MQFPFLTLPPVFLRSHRHCSNEASLSRDLHAATPSLVHTLSQEENSILSVATDENHIYSGSQNQNISVTYIFLAPHARAEPIAINL